MREEPVARPDPLPSAEVTVPGEAGGRSTHLLRAGDSHPCIP